MPILIKDYSWEQNENFVILNINLPVGHVTSKAEVKVGEKMISVMSQTHLFRIALFRSINHEESTLKVHHQKLEFNLSKIDKISWDELTKKKSGKELTEMFIDLLEQERKDIEAKGEEKRIKFRADKDSSVNKQLAAEEVKRTERNNIKQFELDLISQKIKNEKFMLEAKAKKEEEDKTAQDAKSAQEKERKASSEIQFTDVKKEPTVSTRTSKMPPPRQRGKITVEFTERSFPTPLRESNKPEEDAWLQKQAAARKRVEYANGDLTEQDKEDGYLEGKAAKMIKNGDYQSAINALNIACKMFPRKPSIYVLRSEANLKMQNAVRAAEDAARAFEMYQPPVPANLDDRFKCHILRGSALRRLQMYTEALMDFVAAEKLNPKDEDIQQHCADLRNIIQNNGGDEWKKEWETDLL